MNLKLLMFILLCASCSSPFDDYKDTLDEIQKNKDMSSGEEFKERMDSIHRAMDSIDAKYELMGGGR